MIPKDTSVSIWFLANRMPYATQLDRLSNLDEGAGQPLVYRGLLVGDRGHRWKFLDAYKRIHQAGIAPHRELVAFICDRNMNGCGAV